MGALTTGSRGALQRAGAFFLAASTEPMEPENMASPAPAPAPPVGGALPNGALLALSVLDFWFQIVA